MVFVEIGLGWRWIAVAHILGHAVVRTLQFLRAPSMLHDYHRMHSAIGAERSPAAPHMDLEDFFPAHAKLWLYRWALDRGHLDTILDRWVIDPLMQLSGLFARLDRIASGAAAGRHDAPEISVAIPDLRCAGRRAIDDSSCVDSHRHRDLRPVARGRDDGGLSPVATRHRVRGVAGFGGGERASVAGRPVRAVPVSGADAAVFLSDAGSHPDAPAARL